MPHIEIRWPAIELRGVREIPRISQRISIRGPAGSGGLRQIVVALGEGVISQNRKSSRQPFFEPQLQRVVMRVALPAGFGDKLETLEEPPCIGRASISR